MNLWEYVEKQVIVLLKDGHVYKGKVKDYTNAIDNTPEIASICIGHTELYENEIEKIELI